MRPSCGLRRSVMSSCPITLMREMTSSERAGSFRALPGTITPSIRYFTWMPRREDSKWMSLAPSS